MSQSRQKKELKIRDLFDILIGEKEEIIRDDYDDWSEVFQKVKNISKYLERELKHWSGSYYEMSRATRSWVLLTQITAEFIQKCKEFDKYKGKVKIKSFDKQDFLNYYQTKCTPLVIAFANQLQKGHPLRFVVKQYMRRNSIPMEP